VSYIKQTIDCYLNPRWIIFILIVLTYSFFVKKKLVTTAYINNVSFNMWDTAIAILCDPFFIIYFLLPVWITISINLIHSISNENYLIRLSSYYKWLKYSLFKSVIYLIVLQIFLVSITLLVSFQTFNLSNIWSEFSLVNLSTNYTSYYLSNSFLTPFSTIILQVLYLTLFLFIISGLISLFNMLFRSTHLNYAFGVVTWVASIISFKIFMNNIYLNITNYVSVPFTYNAFKSLLWPTALYILFILIIVLVGRFKKCF